MQNVRSVFFPIIAAAVALSACSPAGTSATRAFPVLETLKAPQQTGDNPRAMLLQINEKTGRLERWPIARGGGSHPISISSDLGLGYVGGMAIKDGDLVAMAVEGTGHAPDVALYSLSARTTRLLRDPFGSPIDVSFGEDGTLYALDYTSSGASPVTMYEQPARKPVELLCAAVSGGLAVAVDDENDIFVQGYDQNDTPIVVEIPNGPNGPEPQNCVQLPLKTDGGYAAGLAIDPKTDDLVTLDDPSVCAGGDEGRMTVYPKPYDAQTGRSRILGYVCAQGLRLDAESSLVFIGDTTIDFGQPIILQRSFPHGADLGIYHGWSGGGFTPAR